MDDMASERLDSVENEMEEFFDVNEVDDVDDDNPMSSSARRKMMMGKEVDFYNRRDSKKQPNMRSQSMADKEKEIEFLEKKLKP